MCSKAEVKHLSRLPDNELRAYHVYYLDARFLSWVTTRAGSLRHWKLCWARIRRAWFKPISINPLGLRP